MRPVNLSRSSRLRALPKPGMASLGVGLSLLGLAVASKQPAHSQSPISALPFHGSVSTSNDTPAFWIEQLGLGRVSTFQILNPANTNSALVASTSGTGTGLVGISAHGYAGVAGSSSGGYGIYGESDQNDGVHGFGGSRAAGVYGDNSSSGAGVYGRSVWGPGISAFSKNGLAGDFLGAVRMQGFNLSTSPQAGYAIVSDANGNGTWQPVPKGPKGDKGDKGDPGTNGTNGKDGADGISKFKHTTLFVGASSIVTVPPGFNLIGVTGQDGGTIMLPKANSFR